MSVGLGINRCFTQSDAIISSLQKKLGRLRYGFITNDETGKEIFVHVSSLNGLEIKEGDKVTYSEVEGKKGIVAADVQLV